MGGLASAGADLFRVLIEELRQRLCDNVRRLCQKEADQERDQYDRDDLADVEQADGDADREDELEHRHDRCFVSVVSFQIIHFL